MGIYVYCIGRLSHPQPAGVDGIGGAEVRVEDVVGFAAWVSDLDAPPAPSLERVRVHNAVVEAATAEKTPLPFRFGQWFASRDEMIHSLAERHGQIGSRLDTLDGTLEYGVRVIDPRHQDAPRDRGSGRAYIESLARRAHGDQVDQQRGRDVAAALRSRLGPLVRDEQVRMVGGGTLAAIAHLVRRHDTGEYMRRVRNFPAECPELRFVFTGPWPPYGFVE
jgi:hypothetical protein